MLHCSITQGFLNRNRVLRKRANCRRAACLCVGYPARQAVAALAYGKITTGNSSAARKKQDMDLWRWRMRRRWSKVQILSPRLVSERAALKAHVICRTQTLTNPALDEGWQFFLGRYLEVAFYCTVSALENHPPANTGWFFHFGYPGDCPGGTR